MAPKGITTQPQAPAAPYAPPGRVMQLAESTRQFFAGYFWFILKNVIGWILMLSALPVGVALPGPGGLPLFLIGFALVTFPGKRRLTARVMRGRRIRLEDALFTFVTAVTSLAITGIIIWVLVARYGWTIEQYSIKPGSVVGVCVLAAAVTWLVTRLSLRVVNLIVLNMPRARRFVRPWLRQKGIHLLPPRRRRKKLEEAATAAGLSPQAVLAAGAAEDEEILEIHERHHRRLRDVWAASKVWLRRGVSLALTVVIVVWILKPIQKEWPTIQAQILSVAVLWRLLVGAVMFAIFLLVFRALTWRQILVGFGHRLPVAPAVRIWSISELARYLPGSIWQVVGRVYLIKPYGVRGSVCSTSQILEIFIFLLANVLVAVTCLLYLGVRKDVDGSARVWLYAALALVPALLVVLHPKVFYGAAGKVLARLGKPPIAQRLSGKHFVGLLLWAVLGLLWQGVAVWVVTGDMLNLPLNKWWVVAGAYCLAWIAGFFAFWAPGGLGVREVVFMAALKAALPPQVRDQFGADEQQLLATVAFLSVLLRVWATLGEIILSIGSVLADPRGTLGYADAPGRVPVPATDADDEAPLTASPAAVPEPIASDAR